MIGKAIEIISKGKNLTALQMRAAMQEILNGKTATPEIISFLKGLNKKGPTVEELSVAVAVMRRHVIKIKAPSGAVLDTCGTGGDTSGTFNISTAVAFVASGAGVIVAKHGNRSVSSLSGSADVLEALGINIDLSPKKLEMCLKETGIAFLFAPNLHPAMKYAMPARKAIGKRTMFNLLGPLSNPAGASHQLIGVFAERWVKILASVLNKLGAKHALVVHGDDGLDEITTTTTTFIAESYQKKVRTYRIAPEDFGIKRAKPADLLGGSAKVNAKILLDILKSKTGPKRDIVVLNAAAAIYAADGAVNIKEAMMLAEESIDSKKALKKLELLKEFSHR